MIKAYAVQSSGKELAPFEYEPMPLGPEEVEINVKYCGICHSDLSMIDNEWGRSEYPLVPGHEAAGHVASVGEAVKHLHVGQRVGLGWFCDSCNVCPHCLAGDHNLCPSHGATIVGRHGAFADKVRCHMTWAIPVPEGVSLASAGPLFCGGITVFTPLVHFNIRPTDRVGVIGIGGLGHMALRFMNAWGCEVTAFSSNPDKEAEARSFGAHNFVDSRDAAALKRIQDSLDFIISTVNVPLDWDAYFAALGPKGRLHFVGAVLESWPFSAFPAIVGQKSVSGSPVGSPRTTAKMLEFCARHKIEPQIEKFAMADVNAALDRLRAGKARYRIVLEN